MAKFARLEGNVVVEVLQFEGTLEALQKRFHSSLVWVEAQPEVREGMTYSEGQFS